MTTYPKTLIVNVILDNSVLIDAWNLNSKLDTLIQDLKNINSSQTTEGTLKLGIFAFEGLMIKTIKDYSDDTFNKVPENGFPLMNRMLHSVASHTESYIQTQLEPQGSDYFRPWMIILSSGLGFDKIDFFETYQFTKKEAQPVIFPFILSKDTMMFDLSKINQVKPFIPLKEYDLKSFGEWLSSMINQRLTIAPDQSMQLSKDMFKGWTQL